MRRNEELVREYYSALLKFMHDAPDDKPIFNGVPIEPKLYGSEIERVYIDEGGGE